MSDTLFGCICRPRRQIEYSLEHIRGNEPLKEVLQERPPFALYHTNRKLTLEPKVRYIGRIIKTFILNENKSVLQLTLMYFVLKLSLWISVNRFSV